MKRWPFAQYEEVTFCTVWRGDPLHSMKRWSFSEFLKKYDIDKSTAFRNPFPYLFCPYMRDVPVCVLSYIHHNTMHAGTYITTHIHLHVHTSVCVVIFLCEIGFRKSKTVRSPHLHEVFLLAGLPPPLLQQPSSPSGSGSGWQLLHCMGPAGHSTVSSELLSHVPSSLSKCLSLSSTPEWSQDRSHVTFRCETILYLNWGYMC